MYEKRTRFGKRQKIIIASVVAGVILVAIVVGIVFGNREKKDTEDTQAKIEIDIDKGDPQVAIIEEENETEEKNGSEVVITEVRDPNRTEEITYGIDVSKY